MQKFRLNLFPHSHHYLAWKFCMWLFDMSMFNNVFNNAHQKHEDLKQVARNWQTYVPPLAHEDQITMWSTWILYKIFSRSYILHRKLPREVAFYMWEVLSLVVMTNLSSLTYGQKERLIQPVILDTWPKETQASLKNHSVSVLTHH